MSFLQIYLALACSVLFYVTHVECQVSVPGKFRNIPVSKTIAIVELPPVSNQELLMEALQGDRDVEYISDTTLSTGQQLASERDPDLDLPLHASNVNSELTLDANIAKLDSASPPELAPELGPFGSVYAIVEMSLASGAAQDERGADQSQERPVNEASAQRIRSDETMDKILDLHRTYSEHMVHDHCSQEVEEEEEKLLKTDDESDQGNMLAMPLDKRSSKRVLVSKFGKGLKVDLDMHSSGATNAVCDGQLLVWQLGIVSRSALTLSLLFDRFKLANGAELYIEGYRVLPTVEKITEPIQMISSTATHTLGAFTGRVNNKDHLHFSTIPVPGNMLLLKLFSLPNATEDSIIHVCSVVHGFMDPFSF